MSCYVYKSNQFYKKGDERKLNYSQLGDKGLQEFISIIISGGFLSEPSSIQYLYGGVHKGKLGNFILCSDTKVITRTLFIGRGYILKEYPYDSISAVSTNKGKMLPKLIIHSIDKAPETIESKISSFLMPDLLDSVDIRYTKHQLCDKLYPYTEEWGYVHGQRTASTRCFR